MGNAMGSAEPPDEIKEEVLQYNCSAQEIIDRLKRNEYSKVVVMAGAGISVSCGIPDFRTPGTGLYDNLQRFNLPTPESVFELEFFKETKGEAFYKLAKEMWPENFQPSPTHLFVRLLHDKCLLQRCFTQNIDTLERQAGLPNDKIVEAHGSFASASCTKCKKPFDQAECKRRILAGDEEGELPIVCAVAGCGGLVKPDIVFFGEGLPAKFGVCSKTDTPEADLLIIMGTSLTVHPFAGLAEMVSPTCPRLLLNMKPVGQRVPDPQSNGLRLRQVENYRDAMIEGACDDAVRAICDALGWREDLETLVEQYKSKVGPSHEPIDPQKAFPKMGAAGLAYNWRADASRPLELPLLREPEMRPESFEMDELEALAKASEDGVAMFVISDFTKLHKNGQIGALLCLTAEANKAWETTHVVAAVAHDAAELNMETIANAEVLMEPLRKEGAGEDMCFHQLAFELGDEAEEVHLWYVDANTGQVTFRWGPFRLDDNLVSEESVTLETEDAATQAVIDEALDEIVQSMGDLPAHLRDD